MKKKLIISIVSIMSFIFVLSGIVVLNNKDIKSTSIEKEVKSDNQEDTTWQEDYIYIKDKKNKHIVLMEYKGDYGDGNITLPAKAIVDGVEYTTMPLGTRSGKMYNKDNLSLTIEDGVKFPPHLMGLFFGNFSSIKIGKVDVSLLDNMTMGPYGKTVIINAGEVMDLSNFDTSDIPAFGGAISFNSEVTIKASKYILGKNIQLKKTFNNMDSYLILSGILLREGTDEVYTGEELAEHYDGSTMSGTYTVYNGSYVSYKPNGTEGYVVSKKLSTNTSVIDNPFNRYGYIFKEWNTKEDGTGTSYSPDDTLNTSEPITLYAIWQKNNSMPELNTKKINLLYHLNNEDKNLFDIKKFTLNYKIKLKYNNNIYTEPIKIIDNNNNEEKTISPKNGIYHISLGNGIVPSGFIQFENNDLLGISLVLPENIQYEIIPYNDEINYCGAVGHKYSGTLNSDKTIDDEISATKADITLYYLTNDPYGKDIITKFYTYPFNMLENAEGQVEYTGTKSGVLPLRKDRAFSYNFQFENGDLIKIHDFPISSNLGFGVENGYGYSFNKDFSGYFTTFGFTIGEQYIHNGIMKFTKKIDSRGYGLIGKKYNFKAVLTNKDTGEPINKKIPYVIFDKDDNKVESGKLQFDENGTVNFKLGANEKIYIGKIVKKYEGNDYFDYLFDTDESILYEYKLTIEELEDKNKFFYNENVSYYSFNDIDSSITNYRNTCSLKFTKKLELDSKKYNYLFFKNYLNNDQLSNIESAAINKYLYEANSKSTSYEDFSKYINSLFTEDIMPKEPSANLNYNEIIQQNMDKINKTKVYELYDQFIKDNFNSFSSMVLKDIPTFKFKLTLKDENLLTNNNFTAILNSQNTMNLAEFSKDLEYDEKENKYTLTFEVPATVYLDGEQKTDNVLNFNNLWCGMEYEIEELDADKYEVINDNTKGTLISNDTGSVTNVNVTNKLKSGSLTLNKKIKDDVTKDEEFEFEISLDLDEKDRTEYKYTGSKEGYIEFKDGKATITLKGGESIKIEDLPLGVEYKVVEKTKGYKVTKENDKGTIDKETIVTFTNSKKVKKASEIVNTLDGVGKYIAVALVSIIGIVTTILLRKHSLER